MTETIGGEDFLDGMPPGGYLDGQTENTTGSIGRGWKGIGDDGSR